MPSVPFMGHLPFYVFSTANSGNDWLTFDLPTILIGTSTMNFCFRSVRYFCSSASCSQISAIWNHSFWHSLVLGFIIWLKNWTPTFQTESLSSRSHKFTTHKIEKKFQALNRNSGKHQLYEIDLCALSNNSHFTDRRIWSTWTYVSSRA